MNSRIRVGLDFDDVLVDFNSGMAAYHNKYHGTSYTREQITSWAYEHLLGCSKEEALRRMKAFVTSHHHASISPVAGAVDAIRRLKRTCDLHIITARDELISEQTHALANLHFPKSFKAVHFLHREGGNILGNKGEVCAKLGIDIFVEDALTNALHASDNGIRTLLLDAPWNQTDHLPPKITRVYSWEQTLEEILSPF